MPSNRPPFDLRLAELMTALSVATDFGMGYPMEAALTACVLAVRLGESLGLSEHQLSDVYYFGLLRFVGCNGETYAMSAVLGDELQLRREFAMVDPGQTQQVLDLVIRFIRQANEGASPARLLQAITQGVAEMPQMMQEHFTGNCEAAQRLALRLGLSEGVIHALGQVYERWDGRGLPRGVAGEAVSPAVLLVSLAQDALFAHRLSGLDGAINMVKQRNGGAYDPRHADRFCEQASMLMKGLEAETAWSTVLEEEPGPRLTLTDAQFNNACWALADYADVKSPYTLGHSPAVADLAARAARKNGLSEAEATTLWRAGMVHDIGRVGVSAGIWVKQGPLSERDWEKVRLHPYYTERILARPQRLASLGALAGLHHERLDGSGYHRQLPAPLLSAAARLLAAADVYHALLEPRPHRAVFTPEAAAEELDRQAKLGRLDPEVVRGVLAVAGHAVPRPRGERSAKLTKREIEVLSLIARGKANKEMAQTLTLSVKTIDNHIQHIYEKIGVSSRAAATLFAVENSLYSES